ncbi:hypothetical protein DPQ33_01650 [Oceanidesulfovibrio indonesiensis]|uniref:Uncharacterized protein n=1 Tax=Oceanidesulfovibrio indonesiensis TaxID=54767 RepID=A0A7M3MKR9_9BACT|nr:hypothetical protein [Oceanidesulfovibrio indonesiensis]TVM19956.1 hypothetical protein DPQ33_01650 [Oceanidesulfovibrio indonesiensis]
MQDMIEEYRGDLWEWGITVSGYDEETGEETPVDLSGATLLATLKRRLTDADEDAVLAAEVVEHEDAAGGVSAVRFETERTSALEPGEYAADMRLLPGPYVLWRGVVIVKEPVTGRTS